MSFPKQLTPKQMLAQFRKKYRQFGWCDPIYSTPSAVPKNLTEAVELMESDISHFREASEEHARHLGNFVWGVQFPKKGAE